MSAYRPYGAAASWILGLILSIFALGPPSSATAAPARKTITATQLTEAPTLDGRLDDPAWRAAHFVSDFLQKQPTFNAPPTRRTEVALAYDQQALYVAARMYANGRDDIQAVMTRRDVTGSAERIIISIDPFLDRRTAYSFAVTAAGVRADWYHTKDSEFSRDSSFNPVWSTRVHHDDTGWTAEVRIPFTQLRFPRGADQRWGINFNRYIPQRNEDIFWIPVPKEETAWSSYFGDVVGLTDIRQPLRIEFLPYVTGDTTLESKELVDEGQPRLTGGVRAGGDLAMGLGPNMTLNATVFPDFGQVEADPAVVNLSGFEIFFAERRPFFTEGGRLLEGEGKNFYYSRRIGARPLGCSSGDSACPNSTPILGAAKLIGRFPSSRLSVGAVTAMTGHAYSLDADTGERTLVSPLASYTALRVQQEVGDDGSIIGASLAGVARDLDDGDVLAQQILRNSIGAGIDWELRFDNATHVLEGTIGFTRVAGSPAAIELLARNPVHFFQRAYQSHVSIDDTARSMTGLAGELQAEKRQGNWLWEVEGGFESPGFDPNQLGSLQSADDIWLFVGGTYRDVKRGRYLHRWGTGIGSANEWNFGGARDPGYHFLNSWLELKNFWNFSTQVALISPGQSDHATRGGPLMGVGWGTEASWSVSSPFAQRYRWNASLAYEYQQTGNRGWRVSSTATMQPLDRLSISLSPSYWTTTNNRQYVTTVGYDPDTEPENLLDIDPASYIFGTIERRQLSLQTRIQVAVTPDLTIDTYVEPFAASGRYTSFGALAAPGSRALREWTTREADDFTSLSLRSTAVLRWEFIPGSTLFFVWQQNRGQSQDMAENVLSGLGRAFSSTGGTTLAVKLSYWLDAEQIRSWSRSLAGRSHL